VIFAVLELQYHSIARLTERFELVSFYQQYLQFLSRVSMLTRDTDIANLSVCPSVHPSVNYVPVLYDSKYTVYLYENFRQYSRRNAESAYLKIICLLIKYSLPTAV